MDNPYISDTDLQKITEGKPTPDIDFTFFKKDDLGVQGQEIWPSDVPEEFNFKNTLSPAEEQAYQAWILKCKSDNRYL